MKSAEQWLEELGINTGEKVCVEIEDVRRIQNDAILLGAEICNELKETAGSLQITSKRQMAELCEKEIRMAAMPNDQKLSHADRQPASD